VLGLFSPLGSLSSLEGNEGQGAHRREYFPETQLKNFKKMVQVVLTLTEKYMPVVSSSISTVLSIPL
jgi:hypothetical protein